MTRIESPQLIEKIMTRKMKRKMTNRLPLVKRKPSQSLDRGRESRDRPPAGPAPALAATERRSRGPLMLNPLARKLVRQLPEPKPAQGLQQPLARRRRQGRSLQRSLKP